MPDLGTYAVPVLTAYAGTLALLLGLVVVSMLHGRRVKRQLAAIESRRSEGTQP